MSLQYSTDLLDSMLAAIQYATPSPMALGDVQRHAQSRNVAHCNQKMFKSAVAGVSPAAYLTISAVDYPGRQVRL